MEIGEQQLKTILTEQCEEYQRYADYVFGDLKKILTEGLMRMNVGLSSDKLNNQGKS